MSRDAIERACASVVHRSYRALDNRHYDQLAECFHPDAVWLRQGAVLSGHAEILEALHQRPARRVSAHFVSNLEVDVRSDDTADVSYLMMAYLRDDPELKPGVAIFPSSISRYEERLERRNALWGVVSRRSERLF